MSKSITPVIADLVEQMLSAKAKLFRANTAAAVYELYGLPRCEIKIVEQP